MPTSAILPPSPAQIAPQRGPTAPPRAYDEDADTSFERTLADVTGRTHSEASKEPVETGTDAPPDEPGAPQDAQLSGREAHDLREQDADPAASADAHTVAAGTESASPTTGESRAGSQPDVPDARLPRPTALQQHTQTTTPPEPAQAGRTNSSGGVNAHQGEFKTVSGGVNPQPGGVGIQPNGGAAQPAAPAAAVPLPTVVTPPEVSEGSRSPKLNGDPRATIQGQTTSSDPSPAQGRLHPAAARAIQVQDAVRVENLTGQAPAVELGGKSGQAVLAVSGVVHTAADDAAAHAPLPSPSGTSPDGDGFTTRMVRGLSALVNQRGGVMHMRLDPPDLGALRVQMTLARGTVAAEFQPATAQAHSLLERGMATLRAALESHGLVVDRLTVHTPPPVPSAPLHQEAADREQQPGSDDQRGGEQQREPHADERDDAAGRHAHTDAAPGEEPANDRRGAEVRQQSSARGRAWSLLRAFASSTPP